MNRLWALCFSTVLAVAAFAAFPSEAHAGRGILIYNNGKDVFEAGPIPAPFAGDPQLRGYVAAYECDVVGVFWVYFWISGCRPVAYNEDQETIIDDPRLTSAIAGAYTESDKSVGFWKGYMRYVLLLLLVLGGGAWLYEKVTGKSLGGDDSEGGGEEVSGWGQPAATPFRNDPRVQHLLTFFGQQAQWTFDQPTSAEMYRVVNAKAYDGPVPLALADPRAKTVVMYMTRGATPTHVQVTFDLATGTIHPVELQAMAFATVAV